MFPRRLVLDFEGRRLQGLRPFAVFNARNGAWTWHVANRHTQPEFPFRNGSGDALTEIQRALCWCQKHIGGDGAALGFLAYDLARHIEPRAFTTTSPADDLQMPDARLVFYESLQNTPFEYSNSTASSSNDQAYPANSDYLQAIERIQQFIAAGDIYQANFATRFAQPLRVSPVKLYERLRATHAMPFSALLEWDDLALVSNSPERFLRLQNLVLTAQPIKGTIPRGDDFEQDEQRKRALEYSKKDRAENVMIVDLLRNDLGRVCEYGSVRVPRLFEVQTFPTLHHLVSTVEGTLRPELDGVDALRACFPCGSITGAPKIRAMQIIDDLESSRRGAAMGAIGYLAFNGDMDWNVAIRTITCKNDQAFFHAGGGIVADSRAPDEYAEMQLKAQALRAALDVSGS